VRLFSLENAIAYDRSPKRSWTVQSATIMPFCATCSSNVGLGFEPRG